MIEGIKGLHSELELQFSTARTTCHTHVPVADAGPTKDVTPAVAVRAGRWLAESRCVEPVVDVLVKSLVGIADNVCALAEGGQQAKRVLAEIEYGKPF